MNLPWIKLFLLLPIIIISLSANLNISLTNEEKEFIKNNPIITAHNEMNTPPYNYNINGKARGYLVEYIKLLASKINIKIDFISGYTWNEFIELSKKNQIDLIINIAKTKPREKYLAFTTSFMKAIDVIVVKNDRTNLNSLQDFENKRLAVIKGFFEEYILKEFYPNIKLVQFDTSLDALKAVSFGTVDGFIDGLGVINYLIAEYGLSNISPSFEISNKRFDLDIHIATNKRNRILRDILEKAKQSLTQEEIIKLNSQWLSKSNLIKNIKLSLEEKEFIKNNTLKVGVEQWKPAIYSNDGTDIDGVTGDFLKEIIKLTGLKIKIVNDKWSNIIFGLEKRTIDIIPATYYTKKREKFGIYGDAYFKIKDFLYI